VPKKIVVVFFICVFLLLGTTYEQEDNNKSINVSGKSEVSFEPDIAYVLVGVSGVYQDVVKGQKDVNEKVNGFTNKIKSLVAKENISTERLSINNSYEYVAGKRQFMGYIVDQNLRIILKDITLIGKVIDVAVNSGLNNIGQISFSSSRIEEYKQKALKFALIDAKDKAQLIAKTMDIGKIRIKEINESGDYVQPLRVEGMQMKALAVSDTATQYQVGEMKVNSQVNVIYEF